MLCNLRAEWSAEDEESEGVPPMCGDCDECAAKDREIAELRQLLVMARDMISSGLSALDRSVVGREERHTEGFREPMVSR